MSNNGSTICKKMSFINKKVIVFLLMILLIIIVCCSFFVFAFWVEMPMLIKIFWPILSLILLMGILITPLNGMVIGKKGTIVFIPDFRIKVFKISDLEKMALVFTEQENNKYSVLTKLIFKNGKIFIKDYSKQFKNIKKKKLALSVYTIKREKVNKISQQITNIDICTITILDKNDKIIKH